MRLSCTDSSFPRLSHEVALAVIRDLDVRGVDVCVFTGVGHTQPEDVRADPVAAAALVRPRLERAGLEAADVFLILGFDALAVNHPDAEVRRESLAYFEATVGFASGIGAPGVTVLPGVRFGGVDPDVSLRLAADELRRRAEIASASGLRLSIEPHYESIVATPERTLALLDLAPEVSLALDPGHFIYQGFAQAELDGLIPHAGHVHLRQAAEGAMQLPADAGAIDFPLLRRRLEAAGYEGWLALEYQWDEWLDFKGVDCISESAALRDLVRA